jgi:hypothetical protein
MQKPKLVECLCSAGRLSMALLLCAFTVSALNAHTIDFEDIAVALRANVWGEDQISGGFLFDSLGNHTHLDNNDFRVDNGSTYLATDDAGGPSPLTMSVFGGGTFTLHQLDLGEWVNENVTARVVTITGNFANGSTLTASIGLNMVFDGTFGSDDFQTVTFGAHWKDLASVAFKGTGAQNTVGGNNYFTLDNIVVTAVPEPATLLTAGIAVVAVIVCLRNRVAKPKLLHQSPPLP